MTEPGPPSPEPVFRHMVRGSAWAITTRWGIRAIGLVNTIILARLLVPADFGIVAMGALAIELLMVFADTGVMWKVLRQPTASRADFDTAWTVRLISLVLLGLVLALTAPLSAAYFNEPRLVPVMLVLACRVAIGGLENIGIVVALKDLDFYTDFRYGIFRRLVIFAIVIVLAIVLRSYWALVIGELIGTAIAVGLSYVLHPYRPRFSLVGAGAYVRFALAMVPINIAQYLNERLDVLVVGGTNRASQLGVYNVASELSAMVTNEFVMPIGRGLYPTYSRITDTEKLASAVRHVVATIAIICFPLGLGLSVVADDFVFVILGEKWLATVPLVRWLAVYAMVRGLLHYMSSDILIVTGRERLAALSLWLRVGLLAIGVAAGASLGGLQQIAVAVTIAAVAALVPVAFILTRAVPVGLGSLLANLIRPAIAASVMAVAVWWLKQGIALSPPAALAIEVVFGGLVYAAASALLWGLAGRPDGPERRLDDLVRRAVQGRWGQP